MDDQRQSWLELAVPERPQGPEYALAQPRNHTSGMQQICVNNFQGFQQLFHLIGGRVPGDSAGDTDFQGQVGAQGGFQNSTRLDRPWLPLPFLTDSVPSPCVSVLWRCLCLLLSLGSGTSLCPPGTHSQMDICWMLSLCPGVWGPSAPFIPVVICGVTVWKGTGPTMPVMPHGLFDSCSCLSGGAGGCALSGALGFCMLLAEDARQVCWALVFVFLFCLQE